MAYCKRCGFPAELLNSSNNDPQRQLVEVEDEILQLEVQLSKHLKKRGALRQQINARISPLLRLPLDILSEISIAAFPAGDVDSWNTATPLLLGSICRTWRDLTWSIPRLWCMIRVDVQERYRMSKASLLEEWLLRSRKLPVSVELNLLHLRKYASYDTSVIWKIMDLAARCSERWEHVHLDIPFFFKQDNCFVPKGFSQLRSLSMSHPGYGFSEGDRAMFQHAPILSNVSLQTYFGGILLPTNSLTRLTLENTWVSQGLTLLKRHPNLVHCTFKSMSPNPTQVAAKALSLESLEINLTDPDGEAIAPLLDNLFAPALRELTIHMRGGVFPHNSLISILLRSSCPLVRLDLFKTPMLEAHLIECLTILPSLRELKLGRMVIGIPTIRKLTLNKKKDISFANILLPNLVNLSLVLIPPIPFALSDLTKMARSRLQERVDATGSDSEHGSERVARMETFTVHILTFGLPLQGVPTLTAMARKLEDEGMKVSIKISDT